jgi:hypothetical protein
VIQRVRNAPAADVSGPVYDAGGEQLHRNLGFNKGLKYAIGLLTPKPLDYIESTTVSVDTGETNYFGTRQLDEGGKCT